MAVEYIKDVLSKLKKGKINQDEALEKLKNIPYEELGFAKIDHHRELRRGYPEVIFCSGKTPVQVSKIVQKMLPYKNNILATRANNEVYNSVKKICKSAVYAKEARLIMIEQKKYKPTKTSIAVVSAGTSDIPVAEEAALTAEFFGNKVDRIYDVGIAGIHRFYDKAEVINKSRVVIVVAGMEGALPSFVAGQIDKPVIAVPTSVGYGANFGGVSALLGMLNSCASGLSVVNIDNGFGAGFLASMINKL